MKMEHIPQDYLEGDLSSKTTIELKELLTRQQNLQKKIKFLRTLPDGGRKIQDFAEKLQLMIEERTNTITSISPEIQNVDQQVSKKTVPLPVSRFKMKNVETSGKQNTSNSNGHDKFNSLVGEESKLVSLQPDSVSALNKNTNSDSGQTRDTVLLTDLEETLNKMEIGSKHDSEIKQSSEEYILGVIERTHNNRKRSPFKLNRELRISKVEDLPPKFRQQGKTTHMETDSDNHSHKKITSLWEESAVCPPNYKYPIAQEMSLQESMRLQENQKKTLEESQAVYAAEKLAAKLNIKMEKFNPEGKDMSYREPEVMDSDDDLEEVD